MDKKTIFTVGGIYIAAESKEEAYNIFNNELPQSAKIYPQTYAKKLEHPEEKRNVSKGLRHNEGKPKWGLIYYKGQEPMIRAFEYGANKYGIGNWQKGLDKREILESMQRHLASLMDGEIIDVESGLPHMGFIQANANMYNYMVDQENNDK